MSDEMDGAYEAVPVHCFACAARDAEHRRINDAQNSDRYGGGSFDGLYVAVTERGE